jgi:hypothetical protein
MKSAVVLELEAEVDPAANVRDRVGILYGEPWHSRRGTRLEVSAAAALES